MCGAAAITPLRTSGCLHREDNDRGAVSVEAALAVCSLVLFLGLLLAGVTAVVAQLRCTDAAVEAARLVARGERQRADEAVARLGPANARSVVQVQGDEVSVEVSVARWAGLLPIPWIGSRAFAVVEPAVAAPPGE